MEGTFDDFMYYGLTGTNGRIGNNVVKKPLNIFIDIRLKNPGLNLIFFSICLGQVEGPAIDVNETRLHTKNLAQSQTKWTISTAHIQ